MKGGVGGTPIPSPRLGGEGFAAGPGKRGPGLDPGATVRGCRRWRAIVDSPSPARGFAPSRPLPAGGERWFAQLRQHRRGACVQASGLAGGGGRGSRGGRWEGGDEGGGRGNSDPLPPLGGRGLRGGAGKAGPRTLSGGDGEGLSTLARDRRQPLTRSGLRPESASPRRRGEVVSP